MFTSVCNNDGMDAIKQKFSDLENHSYYTEAPGNLPKKNENDFQFSNELIFKPLALLWERNLSLLFVISSCPFVKNRFLTKLLSTFRFLDNIFMVWTHGIEKFNALLESIDSHHPFIKLEATINDKQIKKIF